MDNAAITPVDLRDRTLFFAKDVIRFSKDLPITLQTRPIIDQLIRSSTSIGANFVEAKNASSMKDFRNKVFISKKEASETIYWLKLCEEFTTDPVLIKLQDECRQIVLILQRIITPLAH